MVQFGGKVQYNVYRSTLVFGKIGNNEKSLAIGGGHVMTSGVD